jgi:predicted deacylase
MNVAEVTALLAAHARTHTVKDLAGGEQELRVLRFGDAGARPKVFLQAGLHADELPGMLVLNRLARALAEAESAGKIRGEIIVIPAANPIGLAQKFGEWVVGRSEFGSGRNFNRGLPDFFAAVSDAVAGALGNDPVANVALIRGAMRAWLDGRYVTGGGIEAAHLILMRYAHDADIALDLHADNEALLHIYTTHAFWPRARDLAAELDARAILLCDDSGADAPFDEALSLPWLRLSRAFPDAAIPQACFSATLELRSNNDVDDGLADRDARALMRFLVREGVIDGEIGALPRLLCDAAPLEAMQQVRAPIEGLIVYHRRLGDAVRTGDRIATIISPHGPEAEILAVTDGLLFARHNQNWAWPGKVVAKIAGTVPLPDRVGDLLSP